MRIGNRIFPYPALNNNIELSDYKNSSNFSITLDLTENGDIHRTKNSIVLKNIKYKLSDLYLQQLLDNHQAEVALVVDCSASLFRKKYELTDKEQDIIIPIHLLKDEVVVSAYMYTSAIVPQYSSDSFHDDYKDYSFNLEPYSIIAIDDGIKFKVDINENVDNKNASIFMVIRQDDLENIMKYENGDKKINIYLSPENYANYETLKEENTYYNEFFSMIVIPVLTSCLGEIQSIANYGDNFQSIEEIVYNKAWFKSVCFAYERETNDKLTFDVFKDINALELAQIVLNYATSKGIQDFCDLIIGGSESGEN